MSDRDEALEPAKRPVGAGSVPVLAEVYALALIVLGGVFIQEVLVRLGAVQQDSWTGWVLKHLDGTRSGAAQVLAAAIVLAVLGLLMLPVAFLRRPRTALPLRAGTGVHLRTRDLGRMVKARVEGADAVTGVQVAVSRRRLRVQVATVATGERRDEIRAAVLTRIEPVLAALEKAPRPSVSVRSERS